MYYIEIVCNVCGKVFKSFWGIYAACDKCLENYESPFKDSDFLLKKVKSSLRKRKGTWKYLYKEIYNGYCLLNRQDVIVIDYFDIFDKYIAIYYRSIRNRFKVLCDYTHLGTKAYRKEEWFDSFEDAMVFVKKLLPIRK